MYFDDLSPYSYDLDFSIPEIKMIGWLQACTKIPQGDCGFDFLNQLKKLACMRPANQMRGFHICDICHDSNVFIEIDGFTKKLGSAEIWVPSNNVIYAAPNLVIHYIESHGYFPPYEFQEAVMNFDVNSDWDSDLQFSYLCGRHLK